jgi:mono/diheme cytochrome c family protein
MVVVSVLLAVGACSKEVSFPDASEGDVKRIQEKFPEASLDKLQKGKALYLANCGSCHRLYAPSSKLDDYWESIVPPMADKARISEEEEALILQYLIAKSKPE